MEEKICEGKRVYLRQVNADDAVMITRWKLDPVVQKMALGGGVKVDIKYQKADIARALDSVNELYAVIIVKETGAPVGYMRINWMDTDHRFAWLRFALGTERGKGYGKDALKCFLKYLFDQGAHRIDAEAYVYNEISLSLMESLGFKKEGIKRQAHYDGGQGYVDVMVLGLLSGDFKE